MEKIKVLIVDDSLLIRKLLREIIESSPRLTVIGEAEDPFDAREKIKKLVPDVITLDVEMPKMDGITFLRNVMRLRPMPVVMLSTLTEKGAQVTIEALEIGAVDYVAKPKINAAEELPKLAREIISKITMAAKANVHLLNESSTSNKPGHVAVKPRTSNDISLVAIGASTGGVEATKSVLERLPSSMPPIVIVQHMPGGFTTSYAKRLNDMLPFTVTELKDSNITLHDNHIYLANGDQHMGVRKRRDQLIAYCEDAEPIHRHKPAVDFLFNTVADSVGNDCVGVLLTGMGVDGAAGMAKLKATGAETIAQDKQTSVVWGMPRVAIEQGAASHVMSLNKIADYLGNQCS